jgi:hypothetical protein
MPTSRFDKFLAVAGVLAGIVFAIAGFHSDPPSVSSGAHAQLQWYVDHKGTMYVAGFASGYFAVLMAFFATGVRRVLRSGEPGESTYSTAALVGGVLVSSAAVLNAVIGLATVEAADKGQEQAVATFGFINDVAWLPLIAGLGVFYLATGLGGLRTATLPRWLSIVTIVLGVACVAGPTGIAAWFATPLWLVVMGVLMLRTNVATPASSERTPAYA